MFRVLLCRLLPVLAVLFGVLTFGSAAQARSEVQVIQSFEPGVYAPAQPRMKKRAYRRAHAHSHRHLRASRHAHYRAHAQRNRHAHMRMHRRAKASLEVAAPARAAGGSVVARVDLASQRMVVSVNGEVAHVWHVSTARKGYVTPRGVYGPQRMHVSYFSKKYYNSPMPYAVFFKGGYAVHGTGAIKALGRPASHGCIRLATGNARTLFNLIRAHGTRSARIVIS